jgi:hypothetical protein
MKMGSGVLVCCWLLFQPAGASPSSDLFYFSIQVSLGDLRI